MWERRVPQFPEVESRLGGVDAITTFEERLRKLQEQVEGKPRTKDVEKLLAEMQLQLQVRLDEGSVRENNLIHDVQRVLNIIRDDIVADRQSAGSALRAMQAELNALKVIVTELKHGAVARKAELPSYPVEAVPAQQPPQTEPVVATHPKTFTVRKELRLKRGGANVQATPMIPVGVVGGSAVPDTMGSTAMVAAVGVGPASPAAMAGMPSAAFLPMGILQSLMGKEPSKLSGSSNGTETALGTEPPSATPVAQLPERGGRSVSRNGQQAEAGAAQELDRSGHGRHHG